MNDRFKAIFPAGVGVSLAGPMTIMVPCLRQCFYGRMPFLTPTLGRLLRCAGIPILNQGTHRDHSSQQAGTQFADLGGMTG